MTSNINQRVLNALKEAKEKLAAIEQQKSEAIAIIGMAGRFPGANDISDRFSGKIGIFAGSALNTYLLNISRIC